MCCLPCIVVIGALFAVVFGVEDLVASRTDTRGQKLQQFSTAMKRWTMSGERQFEGLRLAVGTGTNGTVAMTGSKGVVTPSNFGESSFNQGSITTPSSLPSYKYTGTAKCPGGTPNRPCTISLKAQGRVVITKQLTPAKQQGPTPMSLSSGICQWYDSDYWHPMAAVGMGRCNNVMAGGSQTYNYGPSECVEEHYLDHHGCPNDLLNSRQLIKAGWSWASYISSQPRFTYEGGKCWDYTDCFCTGCGFEFKTDTTKGWGFTGYGYYYGGSWFSFPKPFSSMSGNEKAHQPEPQPER